MALTLSLCPLLSVKPARQQPSTVSNPRASVTVAVAAVAAAVASRQAADMWSLLRFYQRQNQSIIQPIDKHNPAANHSKEPINRRRSDPPRRALKPPPADGSADSWVFVAEVSAARRRPQTSRTISPREKIHISRLELA